MATTPVPGLRSLFEVSFLDIPPESHEDLQLNMRVKLPCRSQADSHMRRGLCDYANGSASFFNHGSYIRKPVPLCRDGIIWHLQGAGKPWELPCLHEAREPLHTSGHTVGGTDASQAQIGDACQEWKPLPTNLICDKCYGLKFSMILQLFDSVAPFF